MLLDGIQQVEIINQGIDWINIFITFLSVFLGALLAYLFSLELTKRQHKADKKYNFYKEIYSEITKAYQFYLDFIEENKNLLLDNESAKYIDKKEIDKLNVEIKCFNMNMDIIYSKISVLSMDNKDKDVAEICKKFLLSLFNFCGMYKTHLFEVIYKVNDDEVYEEFKFMLDQLEENYKIRSIWKECIKTIELKIK